MYMSVQWFKGTLSKIYLRGFNYGPYYKREPKRTHVNSINLPRVNKYKK